MTSFMAMNKINVYGEEIEIINQDGIEVSIGEASKFLNVQSVKIKILKDTDIFIDVSNVSIKLDFYINVLKGLRVNVYEYKHDGDYKFQYKYYLEENSYLNVFKVNDGMHINEMTVITLNGEGAKAYFNLKTVSKTNEKYNFLVYHNAKDTVSNIINNGVNILDGTLEFNVSGFVSHGFTGCVINQSGRIINMTDNLCIIKPNLFIDEEDVMANHSALIGTFSHDEIFYLMSRGISEKEATMLLTKGFLLQNISFLKKEVEGMINKYWG